MDCLLCSAKSITFEDSFWKCLNCDLIFKDPKDFPSFESEKARYETHNNDALDPAYLKYLDRLFSLTDLKSGSILDYGCGPSKGLAALVKTKALNEISVESYDPIFFKQADLNKKYDLVFASESFEHFFDPKVEVKKVLDLLAPQGKLAVSTEFHDGKVMSEWWYARDPTHVVFYGLKTFEFLAEKYSLEILCLKNPHLICKSLKHKT
jgi:2-polyprenyl-3-methyl-5-hydroxy-6-metoxy-1,4-benzoquinol methylase